jgi:hypothetical protein
MVDEVSMYGARGMNLFDGEEYAKTSENFDRNHRHNN